MEERHAQGPDITSLYLVNTGHGEIMGQRWHGLAVGRGEKPILRFLLGLFWEKCSTRITYHQKEVKLSWNY